MQSKSFLSKKEKVCFNRTLKQGSRLHINLCIMGLSFSMYTEIFSHSRATHLLNGEQPWWSPAKISCLFVLVFRIQPSHYFVESVQKGARKTRNLTLLEFYLHLQTFFDIFSSYRFQIKKISTSKISCLAIFRQNGQLWIFRLNLGKLPITSEILILMTLRGLGGDWNKLGGGGWSWVEVGAGFSNTQCS